MSSVSPGRLPGPAHVCTAYFVWLPNTIEDEFQWFLLLHELQVYRLCQPMFVQHILFGYLIQLEDEFQWFLLLHELQVYRLG
jgi:hypothetical protein